MSLMLDPFGDISGSDPSPYDTRHRGIATEISAA